MHQTMIDAGVASAGTTGSVNAAGSADRTPITLTGLGTDEFGAPVRYAATLVMQPVLDNQMERKKVNYTVDERRATPQNRKQDTNQTSKDLRQSPYFSGFLFSDNIEQVEAEQHNHNEMERKGRKLAMADRDRLSDDEEGGGSTYRLPSDAEAAADVDSLMRIVARPNLVTKRFAG